MGVYQHAVGMSDNDDDHIEAAVVTTVTFTTSMLNTFIFITLNSTIAIVTTVCA